MRKQIEILVVESNPADASLTEIAFRNAGLTSGFRSVSDGADALAYVRKEGTHARTMPILQKRNRGISVQLNVNRCDPRRP
jgi:hypothetical protein